jgi:GDP/UDP-N,N'-diacetylbacillosamine 2-epimerase (hydrolysing)
MKTGVLTSSRADYGIYFPLLKRLKEDPFFQLEIIAFGTHLSQYHGYTLSQIEKDSYSKIHTISSMLTNDDEQGITNSYGLTVMKFADFWKANLYDLVLCLGDRFEMSAAVQAGIPFGVKFCHIHGGETTLGAIDNIYRHQITLASQLHFTATEAYQDKIASLLGENNNIYTVGSLSLDEMSAFKPIEKNEFYQKFHIEDKDFALITFHPETVAVNENSHFANEMKIALSELTHYLNLIITMPNADTSGTVYRKKLEALKEEHPNQVLLIENFGKVNYFSAMCYSKLLIGNTSSGIIEAASFGKYVVNVGDRQLGRAQSKNVFDAAFSANEIISTVNKVLSLGDYSGENVYFKEDVVTNIIKILKE